MLNNGHISLIFYHKNQAQTQIQNKNWHAIQEQYHIEAITTPPPPLSPLVGDQRNSNLEMFLSFPQIQGQFFSKYMDGPQTIFQLYISPNNLKFQIIVSLNWTLSPPPPKKKNL